MTIFVNFYCFYYLSFVYLYMLSMDKSMGTGYCQRRSSLPFCLSTHALNAHVNLDRLLPALLKPVPLYFVLPRVTLTTILLLPPNNSLSFHNTSLLVT